MEKYITINRNKNKSSAVVKEKIADHSVKFNSRVTALL